MNIIESICEKKTEKITNGRIGFRIINETHQFSKWGAFGDDVRIFQRGIQRIILTLRLLKKTTKTFSLQ